MYALFPHGVQCKVDLHYKLLLIRRNNKITLSKCDIFCSTLENSNYDWNFHWKQQANLPTVTSRRNVPNTKDCMVFQIWTKQLKVNIILKNYGMFGILLWCSVITPLFGKRKLKRWRLILEITWSSFFQIFHVSKWIRWMSNLIQFHLMNEFNFI